MFRTVALNAWSPPLVAPPPQRNPGGLGPRRTGTHSSPCSALRRPGNQALQCQAHFTTRRGHYLTFLGFIFSRCDSRVVQSLCRCNVRPDAAGTCRLCARPLCAFPLDKTMTITESTQQKNKCRTAVFLYCIYIFKFWVTLLSYREIITYLIFTIRC